ncbi:MAG: PqqD family protein [Proteobacteria bacterium]|nr:PqqD family protein [Pseudomonadota bacterium]
MNSKINSGSVYVPSDEVVAREIEGELIIVPLTSGVGNMEDELYTLNETGKDIWSRLDGKRNLRSILDQLKTEYDMDSQTIEEDAKGLLEELLIRKMIVEKRSK